MRGKKEILLAVVLGVIIPSVLMRSKFAKVIEDIEPGEVNQTSVLVLSGKEVLQMELEEYITGVLLAEMPSGFEVEALKAQAVAARTFTLFSIENGIKHQDADVCTSAECCQGYLCPDEYLTAGGATTAVLKMRQAVEATQGQALFYDSNLIEATYFSSSGGKTESAIEVWGVSVPYLQSVSCDDTDGLFTKTISKKEFCRLLELSSGEVSIGKTIYTEGNGIAEVSINGEIFTGMQLRKLLGLRSTQISFYVGADSVLITTKGYGHRVGMSQYGANAMAEAGENYQQILTHFYTGVTIAVYDR